MHMCMYNMYMHMCMYMLTHTCHVHMHMDMHMHMYMHMYHDTRTACLHLLETLLVRAYTLDADRNTKGAHSTRRHRGTRGTSHEPDPTYTPAHVACSPDASCDALSAGR